MSVVYQSLYTTLQGRSNRVLPRVCLLFCFVVVVVVVLLQSLILMMLYSMYFVRHKGVGDVAS